MQKLARRQNAIAASLGVPNRSVVVEKVRKFQEGFRYGLKSQVAKLILATLLQQRFIMLLWL
ncbi:MAG: hypothetical protein DMG40_16270 [Acidobacteria bacterium]|nr:MAG: hypothetical protein DMG40_16270 [Acidobacteriota bacterium]